MSQPTELEDRAVTTSLTVDDAEIAALCKEGNARFREIIESQFPRVIIISGPSGVGKDSVIEKLRDVYPDAQYVVTATSRPMRDGEVDGVHYIFLEREEFERQIELGEFIEHELVYENLYGVPKLPIEEALQRGQHVIVKVDVKGAATLRRKISTTASLFLLPESMESLFCRLRARKTEEESILRKRFRTACDELERVNEFDYVVCNESNKLEDALNNIVAIIEAEQRRVGQQPITIE